MRKVALIIGLGIGAAVLASPALASNWAGATGLTGCSGNNMTENSQVAVAYPAVTSAIKAAMTSAGSYVSSSTDLTVSTTTSLTYDDVRVFDDFSTQLCGVSTAYGSYVAGNEWAGVIGLARCQVRYPSGTPSSPRCDKHNVYFDQSTASVLSTAELKANAVHELGHTLGLNHNGSSTSVMKQNNLGVSTLNSHDKGHLNAAY